MSDSHVYTPYHPRWLRRRVSTYWWLEKWSVFPIHPARRAAACSWRGSSMYLLLLVSAVGQGPDSYHAFLDWSAEPWVLRPERRQPSCSSSSTRSRSSKPAPQAMVVHIGRTRVPGRPGHGGPLRGVGVGVRARRLAARGCVDDQTTS